MKARPPSFIFSSRPLLTSGYSPNRIGIIKSYGLQKRSEAVKGCRTVKKSSMKWNSATPKMTVDPETYAVTADGVHADIAPAETLPLSRNYNLF